MAIIQTPIQLIGGNGGSNFSCWGGTDGKILERIGVWSATSRLKAIRVWLTDDAPRTFGEPTAPHDEGPLHYQEFTFQPAELITRLSLWGNSIGTRTGWIYFETNQNRKFDFGMYSWNKKQEYPVDVASGICLGVKGGSGDDIDWLGFVFLRPIAYSKLVNVQYPTLSFQTAGIKPETLKVFGFANNNNSPEGWKFSGSQTKTTSSSWSVINTLSTHVKLSVEASIPEVVKVSGEFGWELSASSTSETSTTRTDVLAWEVNGTAQPGESIHHAAVTGHGVISIPYSGSIEVTLTNGTKFQYPLRGLYSGVSYSDVKVT